jgi:hypothetical protein
MSPQTLRILFGIPLFGHGVGHARTAFPLLGFRWSAFRFLFPNKIGVIAVNAWALASVLWLRWPGGVFDG